MNQLSDLFLKALVLLHQKFVHCSQLPIDSLKTRSLLPLLLTASESNKLLELKHNSNHRFANKTQHQEEIQKYKLSGDFRGFGDHGIS